MSSTTLHLHLAARLRVLIILAACGALLALLAASPAGAKPAPGGVARAALPPGKINHILVIELENEGYAATFSPVSPATYLNGSLRPKGELLQNFTRPVT